jgi:hypothetical protein
VLCRVVNAPKKALISHKLYNLQRMVGSFRRISVFFIMIFQVHYGFNCGSGTALIVSEKAYHDGQWHLVVFSRIHTNGKLIIDNEDVGEGSSKGATKSINILSPYYVGGISPNISNEAKFNIKVRLLPILIQTVILYHLTYILVKFHMLFPHQNCIWTSHFLHCMQCILHISLSLIDIS